MLAAEAEEVQIPEGTPSKTPLKKNKKTLKKLLTNQSRYGIISTERGAEISYCLEGVWRDAISSNKTLKLER